MKNKFTIITTLMFSLLLVFVAFNVQAREDNEVEKGEIRIEDSVQVQVNNEGEEYKIQIQTEEKNQIGEGKEVQTSVQVKSGDDEDDSDLEDNDDSTEEKSDQMENKKGNDNDEESELEDEVDENDDKEDADEKMGEERRSMVANAVQEMLQLADRNKGIGEQVRIVAQNQVLHQEELEESLEEAKDRSGFAKFFIGPKYNKINEAKELLEQNKERVMELNQIQAQITNEADAQKLMEQISLLEKANIQIEESINASEKTFSLLGWFSKIFVKK